MYTGTITLRRKEKDFSAGFCITLQTLDQLQEYLFLLHPKEISYCNSLKFDTRKSSYLLGRVVAKKAISQLVREQAPELIEVDFGVFHFPVVKNIANNNIQVSISHCDNIGTALAFPEEHPLGIDIEKIDPTKIDAMKSQMTEAEMVLIEKCNLQDPLGCTIIWTMKESLSKIFRTGLTLDCQVLEINSLEQKGSLYESTFRYSIQYKAISACCGNYVCSIVLPKNTTADLSDFWHSFTNTIYNKNDG